MWLPSASGAVVAGLAQGAQAPLSTRHWNVEPGSFAENSKVGVALLDGSAGTTVKELSGATVSTVHVWAAGLASTLPAASVARTENVWLPSERRPIVSGLEHVAQAPASTRHSNVEPGSLAENSKVGASSLDGSAGTSSSVVFGAAVSTVQVWEAGVASVRPAGSVARTWKVWLPSARLA